jgi:predicted alpha/beta hydrolase family esterase
MSDAATLLRCLLLPGWRGSGPTHWQSRWELRHGCERVQQSDWEWPRRGDWMARLDDAIQQDARPVVLIAHSLGCHLVAAWSAHSRQTARVRSALLVAPPDLMRDDIPPQVAGWRLSPNRRLPFPSQVVFSQDDPYATPARSTEMAAHWGSTTTDAGARGHLNADSGLGDWPAGWARVQALLVDRGQSSAW